MEGHIIWIIVVIIGVFIIQLCLFVSTLRKLKVFQNIFADDSNDYRVDQEEDTNEITGISSSHDNRILISIIGSINNYLENNSQSTADFHLIKDMVERNCESAEDEINAQVPMPLYCGLMGTMFGILIGVGYLVGTGALAELIGATQQGGNNGVDGIQALLGGVALAMITSICGIIFTTIGSYVAKNAKKTEESKKNIFLSWMQAKLLPELSSDTATALSKLSRNLVSFNKTFSQNTQDLRDTLSIVNETTQGQAELLETVRHLNISRMAAANIEVYDKLKNATDEIGRFGEYVNNINTYIASVQALSAKLDDADERTRMIEEMAAFFKKERANLDSMKALISKTIGEADEKLIEAASNFKTSATNQFTALTSHTASQQEKFRSAVEEQQSTMLTAISEQKKVLEGALQQRMDELQKLTGELQQLQPVKESMSKLEAATQEQNKKIDRLTDAIMKLAEVKAAGNAPSPVGIGPVSDNSPKWPIAACLAVVVLTVIVIIKVLF